MARYKIQFWLNSDKIDELNVADTVAGLKQQRSFSSTVRDGIMIVNELRQGKIDLLLKLYPFVMDAITALIPPPEPPPMPDNADLIEQFRRMLEQQQGRGIADSRDVGLPLFKAIGGTLPALPKAEIKAAALPDASTIADDFLAFIQ
jgi:hypothetical protein